MKNRYRKTTPAALALGAAVLLVSVLVHFWGQRRTQYTVTGYAQIEVQDYGTITVALCGEDTPETVSRFISLSESGAYDGLTFYRVIDGFLVQAGDPSAGEADPASSGERNGLKHTRGAVSMCGSGSGGASQFFIVQEDSTYLDSAYTVFGYVVDGMEIVDAICAQVTPIDNNGTVAGEDQPMIVSIRIS